MASQTEIEKWQRALRSTVPVVGRIRQRGVVKALETRLAEPEVVPLLVEAGTSRDGKAASDARAALRGLQATEVVDALCALWAEKRTDWLGEIIAEKGYIAKEPLKIRILSALKCSQTIKFDQSGVVPFMVNLLEDQDQVIQTGVKRSLEKLPPGPAQDKLCEVAIKDPAGPAARICLEKGMQPSDREQACLFLFVTRQLDKYFQEDFEFQNLRLAYDRADATVQGHVMEVVRSGDRRCLGFFGPRKPLSECTEAEINLAIDSCLRHEDWAKLFQATLQLPLKYSMPTLERFRKSGWKPEDPALKSVYNQMLTDSDGAAIPAPKPPTATSSVFERWLAEGQTGEHSKLSESELLSRLQKAAPAEAVPLVAGLAKKAGSGGQAAQTVKASPHWLIRLAGHATGLLQDLASDEVKDDNYWIKELVGAGSLLDFWPGKATPADLEALSAAPAEAWAGKLGSARKVLRTIMGHRITTGVFEEMVVEATEFAGEFERADEE